MTESATNRFLKRIVPAGHHLCLARHRSHPDPTRAKLSWRQQFIGPRANGALVKAIDKAAVETDTNWYFAVAGYDNSGKRKAENVTGIKVLLLDIDLGKGEGFYADKKAAIAGLRELHQAVPQMPAPWIIDSGNGIHIYYELDTVLTGAQWGPVASLFADVVRAVQPMLLADPVRTKDSASVMRLPGSWNAKQPERLHVDVLRSGDVGKIEEVKVALAKAAASLNVSGVEAILGDKLFPNMPAIPSYMSASIDLDFGGGMDNPAREEFKDLPLQPILDGCGQMRDAADTLGNVPEPLWVNFLRVLNTVKNPDGAAVHFSSGHPTASEAQTHRKLRHIRANFDTATAGCEEFKSVNPSGCFHCPNRGKVWTPSQLGVLDVQEKEIADAKEEAIESAAAGITTPQGYLEQPSTAKQVRTQGRQHEMTILPVRQPGKDATYSKDPIISGHLNIINSSAVLDSIVVNHQEKTTITAVNTHLDVVTQGYTNHITIPTVELTATAFDASTKTLRHRGVVFEGHTQNQRMAIGYYMHEIVKIANTQRKLYRPVKGWRKAGNLGNYEFVAGARHYQPNGKVTDNITSAEHAGRDRRHEGFMERACTGIPVGQLDRWQRGMSVYDGKKMAVAQILLLSGLANMLLPLLSSDKGGIVLALTGKSGKGKTTLLKFMSSFMGDHTRYTVPGSSTSNAIGMLLQQANCMMMPVDDTMSTDGEVFSALLTMVTGGSEKMRMTWDSKDGGTVPYEEGFNTSLLLTSNFSTMASIGTAGKYKDQLQVEAARTRTLEFGVEDIDLPNVATAEWHKALAMISNNYGHAADKFLRYVVDNQTSVTNAMHRLEDEISHRLAQQVGPENKGQVRFWSKFLTTIAMTASVVCNKLSLLPWDHLHILATGEALVADTVGVGRSSDDDLVEAFWTIVCKEENPNAPQINFVARTAHKRNWPDWKTAERGLRMTHSDYPNAATVPGLALPPAVAETNDYRVDVYDIMDSKGVVWRERTLFIPQLHLRGIVRRNSGVSLPVADWSDLHARLVSAGCVIFGVNKERPDRLSTPPARVVIGLSKHHHIGTTKSVVEIRFPKQFIS